MNEKGEGGRKKHIRNKSLATPYNAGAQVKLKLKLCTMKSVDNGKE